MKKNFKILLSTTLALTVVILGVGYVFYYKYLDQVTLQHDNEQISKYKRALDYSSFGIDDFSNRYQELEPALAYANIEAIQSGISAGDYSCLEVVQFYVYRIKQHEAYNAVLELNDAAMDNASRIDKKIKNNEANSLFCHSTMFKSYSVTTALRPHSDTLTCPQSICSKVLLLPMVPTARHWVSHPQIRWWLLMGS